MLIYERLNNINRTLKCKCGNIIDRDYNAALNLLKAGEEFLKRKTLGKDLSEYKAFRLKDYRTECDNQMSELELQLL